MSKIIVNKIKCKKCGAVAVDGGKDYLRRVGNTEDYEELYEAINEDEKDE